MHRLRARVAVAFALLPAALAPAAAQANTPTTREPVLTLEGASNSCVVGTGINQGLAAVLTQPPTTTPPTPYHPAFVAKGFNGLPSNWIKAWVSSSPSNPNGYDQCTVTPHQLAGRLKTAIQNLIATAQLTDPTVTKVDLVGVSYGSTISRLCIKAITGCEALVDDWVGIVPPSHGITNFPTCPGLPWQYLCAAAQPNSNVSTDLNSGDETPGTIEYTTLRATNDGLIQPPGSERLTGAANWSSKFPDTTAGAPQNSTHQSVTGAGYSGIVPATGPFLPGKPAGTAVTCDGSPRTTQTGIVESIAAELADITDRSTWNLSTNTSFDLPLACWNDLLG